MFLELVNGVDKKGNKRGFGWGSRRSRSWRICWSMDSPMYLFLRWTIKGKQSGETGKAKERKTGQKQLPEVTFPNSSLLGIEVNWLVSHINDCSKSLVLSLERWHNEENPGLVFSTHSGSQVPITPVPRVLILPASASSCAHTAYTNSCRHTQTHKDKK